MNPNNLALWSSVEHTDPKFTKEFKRGGGFTGTAINPTWLHKRATEQFGPVGRGWGWTIVEERQVANPAGDTVMWFSKVRVWYLMDGQRFETPEQWGGTEMCGKNKYGPFMDEEAPKKTITDAVGKCLSYLGFAADVFMGLYDDSKYVDGQRREFANGTNGQAKPPAAAGQDVPRHIAWMQIAEKQIDGLKDGKACDAWVQKNGGGLAKLKEADEASYQSVLKRVTDKQASFLQAG